MRIVYLLPLLLILFPLVSAISTDTADYHFAQYESINLSRSCIQDGNFCNPSITSCNITIIGPNGQNISTNKPMTVSAGNTNISLGILPKSERYFGFYTATESCNNGTTSGAETFYFEITADGNPSKVFPTQIGILVLLFVLLIVGMFLKEYQLFRIIPAMGMIIMGVITLYPGYSYINYTTLLGLGIGVISIAIGAFFMIEPYFSRGEQNERYTDDYLEESDDGSD